MRCTEKYMRKELYISAAYTEERASGDMVSRAKPPSKAPITPTWVSSLRRISFVFSAIGEAGGWQDWGREGRADKERLGAGGDGGRKGARKVAVLSS